MQPNLCEYPRRKTPRPKPGDLVVVDSANEKVNVYRSNQNFSFSDVIGMAHRGEIGIVLEYASSDNGSILFHYVKVLFCRGLVGVVHYGLIQSVSTLCPDDEFDDLSAERTM